VSFTAQYRMVYADRHLAAVAALEAAIPDAAALVFACLGVALALHGRRALRARTLNVASVGASVFVIVVAAAPGWRSLAVWAMPPVAYALASDTLIGVIRSWVIARHKHLNMSLAADEVTPLAVIGGAGVAWHDNDLVFCHENGDLYTSGRLNWRFSKTTRRAGIGRWHAHEGRHTAVSIMSSNGVPIQEISDTVGHKSTHVTETVYRHVIVPEIRGGATVMDGVFDDEEGATGEGNEEAETS
jgi:hypothetical protein